jgi:hypothetical protein
MMPTDNKQPVNVSEFKCIIQEILAMKSGDEQIHKFFVLKAFRKW